MGLVTGGWCKYTIEWNWEERRSTAMLPPDLLPGAAGGQGAAGEAPMPTRAANQSFREHVTAVALATVRARQRAAWGVVNQAAAVIRPVHLALAPMPAYPAAAAAALGQAGHNGLAAVLASDWEIPAHPQLLGERGGRLRPVEE